ncbi:MFS transporter [Streptacidiphilus sp. EB103A]|uniref:MFS transporter n=1 Tax=Streptacidiphilus sp. EB103A TaxID=3156275 RepID=UPI0035114975
MDSPPLRRNRDYQWLWSAHALSAFGSQACYIALPLVILSATHSVTDFAVVTFAETVVGLVAALPAGVLVDRVNRKAVLLACDLARALVFALLTLAVGAHRVTLPIALIAATANSVLTAPFGPAASAALRSVVPPSQLTAALSLSQVRAAAATLVGPLLGAALYAAAPALPFIVNALSFLASAGCIAFVKIHGSSTTSSARAHPARKLLPDLTTGLSEVRRSPFLRYTLINSAVVNFAFGGIILTLITANSAGGTTGFHNGLIIACSGGGNLLGSLLAPWAGRHFTPRILVLGVLWITAALVPLLAVRGGIVLTVLLIAGCSVLVPSANIAISAATLHSVPNHLQGRVQTACAILPGLIVPFGPLTAGLLLEHLANPEVFLVFGAVLSVLALFSTTDNGLRHIPDLRDHAAPTGPQPSSSRKAAA